MGPRAAGRELPAPIVADVMLPGEGAVWLAAGLSRLPRPVPAGTTAVGRPPRGADLLAAVALLVGPGD